MLLIDPAFRRSLAAEAIGTFALVFAGRRRDHGRRQDARLGHVGVAITFGLVIMAMIYAVGHVSGAHFNPAVSLRVRADAALLVAADGRVLGRTARRRASRSRGACARRSASIAHVGATLPSGSQGQSFLWEFVLTFFLMFVIMAVATDARAVGEAAAIAIGGTVGLDAMFGGPISGASMNPARSIGPALVSGDLHGLWIYIVSAACRRRARRAHLPVRARRGEARSEELAA